MLGLIQEQHPDRCRLFMQWKQMEWPILVDSLDLLEIGVVPLTIAIDEHGIVRHVGLSTAQAKDIEELFLDKTYPAISAEKAKGRVGTGLEDLAAAARDGDATDWQDYAGALYLAGRTTSAIQAFEQSLRKDPDDGWSHFRLAVALRTRYDSEQAEAADFQAASESWSQALEIDPNNYIWRRRIQQYGPRLTKPYPFYDWVAEARADLTARGEAPWPLRVEPSQSELARPQRSFEPITGDLEEPDELGRITRDAGRLIQVESAVVPYRVKAGEAIRVHLALRPRQEVQAHWNNEVDDLEVWIQEPDGWSLGSRLLSVANPAETLSTEVRRIEVELKASEAASGRRGNELKAYALYYVCEDVTGTCLYRRQDIRIPLSVVDEEP